MFLTRSEYDRGVNTFSPEGRLFQVEYALQAVKLGTTAIGIRTKEGVVLAAEKRITSKLMEPSSVEKIMEVDHHIGATFSGLSADARTLVEHARIECAGHHFTFNEKMPVGSITQALSDKCLAFGEGLDDDDDDDVSMARPFGAALLIAGWDENGPELYYSDPSGLFSTFGARAIGSGSEGAQTALQEEFKEDMDFQTAETLALKTLKQVMEEKLTTSNVDFAAVKKTAEGEEPTFRMYDAEQLKQIIERL